VVNKKEKFITVTINFYLNNSRAKNLRLPTAPSRQYVTSSSPFTSSQNPPPRRSARALESDDDNVPRNPLNALGQSRTSLITRPPITGRRRWPDKSPSRSEYAPSITRRTSPVRSIVSLANRRSRSPASLKGPYSVASDGIEGGKLWMALKEVGLSRQAKNS
jgi:protein SFI1